MKHLIIIAPLALLGCAESPLSKVPYTVTNASGETILKNVVVEEGRCFDVSLTPVDTEGLTVGGGSAQVGVNFGGAAGGSAQIGSGCPEP